MFAIISAFFLIAAANRRVFNGIAKRGKSSTGWFFGLKLHAVINQFGQLVVFKVTSGNVADNNTALLERLTERLKGFLYGDAGYISSIANSLKIRGLNLITKLRENMKAKDLTPQQKYYLKHRGLIESVFHLMKDFYDIDHTRHRSPKIFFINLWAGLIAYSFLDSQPSFPDYRFKCGSDTSNKIVLI